MIDGAKLKRDILNDMRVDLADEFDRNFERKGFFSAKWWQRSYRNPKGSLLMVTGTLRRSIRAEVVGDGVRFTSAVPYAEIHNEGGEGTAMVRAHVRKSRKGRQHTVRAHPRRFKMPERRFIGDGKETQEIIGKAIERNIRKLENELSKELKQ